MTRCHVILILFAFITLSRGQRLPALNVDSKGISVSGVSSGGAMAIQMHVAYSSIIMGVGAFAAPPYWCAMYDIEVALNACMSKPSEISVSTLWDATSYAYTVGSIDNPSYLYSDRVWLFTGTLDTVVHPGVVKATKAYYKHYVPNDSSYLVGDIAAEHAWITNNWGNSCSNLSSPYINNCDFDAAQSLLSHLYNNSALNPKGNFIANNLQQFNQAYYTDDGVSPSSISMGDIGFIYVPSACQAGAKCGLHISFHGCLQSYSSVSRDFVDHAGLNEWAETNNIIILYPQAEISSVLPYNPKGCWDWWGYTTEAYATQEGPQIATIKNMMNAIAKSNL